MDHKDLDIWKRSKILCIEIYKITENIPSKEQYGLISQMQRAAVSVPSNIAEGYRRNSSKDFIRFLSIASGSLAELETQLYISREIYNVDSEEVTLEIIELQKMIAAFQNKLKAKL